MKKSLFIILMVCLAVVGLVSCKNEIEPAQEELIYVSFENGISRALTATLEVFDVDDFYWSYAAKKNDGSGLRSGETAWETTEVKTGAGSVAVQSGKGLNDASDVPVKVPGFSKGYWNFRLFAYTDAARTKLAYWGEADSVLIDSSHHLASVTVSPVSGADGYLRIGTITFVPASGISVPTDLVIYTDEVFELVEEQWKPVTVLPVEGVYTLLAGQYKFTRTYSFDGIPVANGSVIATVYSNLTTTISGTLSELTTYAEFGADQNPDIVRETWGSDIVTESTEPTATVDFTKNLDPSATSKVKEASMPAAAAVAKLEELKEVVGADDNTSSTLKLNLSVDTTDVRQQSVTYDIGMEAVLTYTKNQTQSVAKSDVKNVSDYVLIDIDLTSDITGVTVTHSGETMILTDNMTKAGMPGETDPKYVDINKGTSADPLWVGFYLLETTANGQILHLKTKSFSPFEVTYAMTNYVAAIGNVKYTTLTAAIAAANPGDTIIILSDITTDAGYLVGKTLSIDTNGHTITVNEGANINNRAFKVTSGKLSVYGGGTIDAKGQATKSTGTDGTGCYGAFRAEIGTELYLKDITLKNYRPWGLNVKVLGARAELDNVKIYSVCGGGIEVTDDDGAAGTVRGYAKLTGCEMSQSDYRDWCSVPVSVSGGSSVDVYSTSYTGEYGVFVFSSGGTINIHGGEFTATSQAVLITTYDPQYGHDSVINVYGGTFNGPFQIGTSGHEFLIITGGTFDHDPTDYVAEGYGVFYDSYNKVWIVSPYNVIDQDDGNKGYILATAGENKGYLVNGAGEKVEIDTYKNHRLQLLDSSLSNVVADEIDNFNADVAWTAIHPAEEKANTTDFAGGYGTKIEPYWIENASQMQAISSYYNAKYAYYKVRTAGKIFDASDWTAVNINGSFNGNGAVFQSLNVQLFRSVGKAPSDFVYRIKNLTVHADIRINGYGAALIRQAGNNLILEDIAVHGYIEGNNGAASFVCFGPGNITTASPDNREKMDWKFIRCISDATVYATGDVAVGFIKHPYSYASQQGGSAEAQASCLITIEDSLFEGILYHVNNSYAYKYFVGNANDVLVKTSYSNAFIAKYGNPEGVKYGAPATKVDGKFFIGNYPGEGTKISGYSAYGTVVDRYLGEHYQINVTPGVLPEKYAAFSIQKTAGAVSAKAVLEIAPNGPDGKGAYLGTFMSEDIEVLSTQETIETSLVKYFDIDVNADGVTKQGLDPDGKTFHVYNPASYGTTYSSAGVRVTEYDANGAVLKVTYFAFPKSN